MCLSLIKATNKFVKTQAFAFFPTTLVVVSNNLLVTLVTLVTQQRQNAAPSPGYTTTLTLFNIHPSI